MSDIARFPWPFADGQTEFAYSINVERARTEVRTAAGSWGAHIFDIDDTYVAKMQQRRLTLRKEPDRMTAVPEALAASWDYLLFTMRELAASYPQHFSLEETPEGWAWRNGPLGLEATVRIDDGESIGGEHPLTWIGCQVPSDLLLLTEHEDGRYYLDAVLGTFTGAWSPTFEVGMSMPDVHGPVPGFTADGLTDRLEHFLRLLTPEVAYRRTNWMFSDTGSQRLDNALESAQEWAWDASQLMRDQDWGRMRMRTELEHFVKLPLTGAIMFDIRTYLMPLSEVAQVEPWRAQLVEIVLSCPEDIARYKGLLEHREHSMGWLARH